MNLSEAQIAAIRFVENYAFAKEKEARQSIEEIRFMSNISKVRLEDAVSNIMTKACVALHFHPDRLDDKMQPVVKSLLEKGFYLNQFATKLSNGKLSPVRGGARDLWENTMFGNAYAAGNIVAKDRPCYGALDLLRHPDGPAPRFGACYFVLHPDVSKRCTFTWKDSYRNPEAKGTLQFFDSILAALLTEAFERNFALGEERLNPVRLVEKLDANFKIPYGKNSTTEPARNLDHYIEAQVHGPIALKKDVNILVADPSFQTTETGLLLQELCSRYEISLQWHGGFQLQPADVPSDFRGPNMPSLAARIARNNRVDANVIGAAAKDLKHNPEKWRDRGDYAHCLQELKLLWHVLVRYGNTLL